MTLQPIGKMLLVQVKPPEKKGVLILRGSSDEPVQAEVIGMGEKIEAPVKVGDVVLLFPYCGTKIKGGTEEEPYMIITEKDMIGVMKNAM